MPPPPHAAQRYFCRPWGQLRRLLGLRMLLLLAFAGCCFAGVVPTAVALGRAALALNAGVDMLPGVPRRASNSDAVASGSCC